MGSIDSLDSLGVKLPSITLDDTLAELYKRASPKNANQRLGMVFCGVNSGVDLSADFPRNTKFLYQDTPFNTMRRNELIHQKNDDLRKSLAMKYLCLTAQRDSFIAGKAPVILFHQDARSAEQREHDAREAQMTMALIEESQRPDLIFCAGPTQIPVKEYGIEKLAYKLAIDGLENYTLTHDPETHWFLNSKGGLAQSGLPTPRSKIIQVEGYNVSPEECCDVCKTSKGAARFIPLGCKGSRNKWLSEQTQHILESIKQHPIPFVLKNQQVFGGAGTWVITNEEQKKELLAQLTGGDDGQDSDSGILRKLLSLVTSRNAHLSPGNIIMSDLVADIIGDYGLTFVVTDTGEAVFLAASEQMISDSNAWIGSNIDYTSQDELQAKFSDLIGRVAKWVAGHGVYGPIGVDVLETRTAGETASNTGEDTKYHIVDLNVRPSGSFSLPLLRKFFTSRGLNFASSFSVTVKGDRTEFIRNWKDEFESGRMLILSWYHDRESNESIADVVVAAEDGEGLQREMKRVRDATEEVTF